MILNHNDIFSRLFDIGVDVLGTFVDAATNVITAQTGDSTSQAADAKTNEWWQHAGFASRAGAPTQGGSSCQALKIKRSDKDIIFATRDTRGTKIYGNLKAGETCVYACAGAARTLYKATGHVVHFTNTANDGTGATGESLSVDLSPTGWVLSTPWGGITINASGITITAGKAALTLTAAGVASLVGQQVEVHGAAASFAGDAITAIGSPTPTAPLPPDPTSAISQGTGVPPGKPSTNVRILS